MVFDYLKGINLERYKSYLNEKNLKFSISGALLLVFSLEFSSILLGLIFNNQLNSNNFNNALATNDVPRVIDNPFSSEVQLDGLAIYESLTVVELHSFFGDATIRHVHRLDKLSDI